MKIQISDIKKELCNLIYASESNLGIEVTVPVIYPDGENVTVVVKDEGNNFLITDSGFGAMYLIKEGGTLNKRTREKLTAISRNYGCDFGENVMFRRCSREQLAPAIMIVANASRSIGDQALEIRRRVENDFKAVITDKLKDFLKDAKRLRIEEEYRGLSGRKYKVDHVILDKNYDKEIAFIESIHNRNMVLNRAAQIQDLKGVHTHIQNDVALDDQESWRDEDKRIFENFGADLVVLSNDFRSITDRLRA